MDKSILIGMAISIAVMLFLIAVVFAIVILFTYTSQPDIICDLCSKNCTISDIMINIR